MTRDPQKHGGPGESANSTRASKKNSTATLSRITREILSTLLAALIFAASVWSSVFGMTGQFGPTLEVGYMLAGVGADDR